MAERINSFGMSIFKGVNHGETPDKNSLLLDRLKSGNDFITIEILKSDVMAIDEIIKPTPLTGKGRRV